jgi:hypothetical protein
MLSTYERSRSLSPQPIRPSKFFGSSKSPRSIKSSKMVKPIGSDGSDGSSESFVPPTGMVKRAKVLVPESMMVDCTLTRESLYLIILQIMDGIMGLAYLPLHIKYIMLDYLLYSRINSFAIIREGTGISYGVHDDFTKFTTPRIEIFEGSDAESRLQARLLGRANDILDNQYECDPIIDAYSYEMAMASYHSTIDVATTKRNEIVASKGETPTSKKLDKSIAKTRESMRKYHAKYTGTYDRLKELGYGVPSVVSRSKRVIKLATHLMLDPILIANVEWLMDTARSIGREHQDHDWMCIVLNGHYFRPMHRAD